MGQEVKELKYKLIIWDLDGTLIDTIEDLSAAVNHALEIRGLALHSISEYRTMVGHGVRNLVKQALEASLLAEGKVGPEEELTDAALADFKAYYTGHIDVRTHPYPGMQELLKDLHAAGVKMAVASNKFQAGTEHLIHEFFPDIPFVAILGNRDGYPLKPDPEIVGEVLRVSALNKEDAVMVGDSGTDMRTAANGGIDGIAVGWGYRPMGATPDYSFAETVTELRTLLFGRNFYVSELLSTPPAVYSTPLQEAVYKAFIGLGIPFVRVDTDPGITMEDCAHIDGALGTRIVKTVFVCNRQETSFYLYAMPADKPFVTREFCTALGIPRVSFASAEKLMALTGVSAGATTILSAVLPEAAGVRVVLDRSVADSEYFACTDGTPTCFVRIKTLDLLQKYLPACNLTPTII